MVVVVVCEVGWVVGGWVVSVCWDGGWCVWGGGGGGGGGVCVWGGGGHAWYGQREHRSCACQLGVGHSRLTIQARLAPKLLQKEEGVAVVGTTERPFVPMEVMGKADGDGLGMVHWYAAGDDDMAV